MLERSRDNPDPAKFISTYPDKEQPAVWYKLSDDPDAPSRTAWVNFDVKYKGVTLIHRQHATNLGHWKYVDLVWDWPCPGGVCRTPFPPGEYDVEVTLVGTSERRTSKFTVTSSAAVAFPKIEDAGVASGFKSVEPKAAIATSFKADQDVLAVYRAPPTTTPAWMSAVWSYKGKKIDETVVNLVIDEHVKASDGWYWFRMPRTKVEAGEYTVDLAILGSGEKRTLKFTMEGAPAPTAHLQELQLANQTVAAAATPVPNIFSTKFDGFDTIYPDFRVEGTIADNELVTVDWKYKGAILRQDMLTGAALKRVTTAGWVKPTTPSLTSRPDPRTGFPQPVPAGDYECIVTLLSSGESKSVKFTVTKSIGATPTPPAPRPTVTPAATPRPR